MADEEPLPPLEIPWRLAATTQPLVAGEPDQTSISLFFHEPDPTAVVGRPDDERLVYLKFLVSVSPASFPREDSKIVATFLGEGVPVFHLQLDLRVRNSAGDVGTIRPYFHSAAPLSRRMVQTGVVGADAYEGEFDGQSIGKSGSQMYETQTSRSRTVSAGASAGFAIPIPVVGGIFGASGSVRTTSTDVTSDRAVAQTVDTTSRQAAEERRELVSHTTRVENVLTLLTAKSLGTPHLGFSLMPQPLQTLSIDPTDPNLWFNQLLARRSTGIEGIQEFTAVVVVPRDEDFCIEARLRRVCVLDSPPGPFTIKERFNGTLLQLARIVDYLYGLYPVGTPLEELDVDLIGGLSPANEFRRPVVELWALRLLPGIVEAIVLSPHANPGVEKRGSVNYKAFIELWLELLREEYEREVARSPVERGVLLGENRFLKTCFSTGGEGGMSVTDSTSSVGPLVRVPLDVGVIDIGGVKTARALGVRDRAVETVTRWNALEQQLGTLLAQDTTLPDEPVTVSDPHVRRVLLDRWSKLSADDDRNFGFDQAADLLSLDAAQRRQLKAAGATDLRTIAQALKVAPEVRRHNDDVARLKDVLQSQREAPAPPDPITVLSDKVLAGIDKTIGTALTRQDPTG
jgi:hypothetical protein